ncbi:MAG TPA: YncE family protein [Chloroflexota bacterium]|jgi:DNA-binding beta-propeller fold protein YncE|nr:YncE family protein [Chloroflexota bacterium]
MTLQLSRRSLLRALAAAPVAVFTSRGSTSAQEVSAPVSNNVWAAITGPIADSVADLPPRVYVPHENGGDVVVIDPTTRQIVDRFSVGRVPHHVTPAYDLSRLYVSVMGASRLVEIDIRAGRPVRSIGVATPYNLYFSPDGSLAIVASEPNNRLDFFDPITWRPVARLPIRASGIDHLDFSADGQSLLVSAEFSGHVVRVDLEQLAVSGILAVGGLPIDIKLAPDGDVFYVANQGRHGVSIIDADALREVGFLRTGRGAHGLAISRDTRALYVSNRIEGSISVIDFASREVVDRWSIGGSPDMLQVSPDGTELWASGRSHGAVYVVDTISGVLLERIRTGAAPHGLTYFPQPGRVCLGHNGVYR